MFTIWHWLRKKMGVEQDRVEAIHSHNALHEEVMLAEARLHNLEQLLCDLRRENRLRSREVTRLTLELDTVLGELRNQS